MFWILAGLWEIRIRILEHGILIPVPELLLHSDVPWNVMILSFLSALAKVLIQRGVKHESTSFNDEGRHGYLE